LIALLTSVLTLAYLLSMQRRVFFGKLKEGLEHIKEVEPGFALISIILALIIIAAGIFFPVLFHAVLEPLKQLLAL